MINIKTTNLLNNLTIGEILKEISKGEIKYNGVVKANDGETILVSVQYKDNSDPFFPITQYKAVFDMEFEYDIETNNDIYKLFKSLDE